MSPQTWLEKIRYSKRENLNVAREKILSHKGTLRRLTVHFHQNLAGQEKIGWYIQNIERMKQLNKNTLPGKVYPQNEIKVKHFLPNNTEGIYHH